MKRIVVLLLLCIVFAGIVFSSDIGFGYGVSFYGDKDSKISKQNGATAFLSYNFYRTRSYVDVYSNVMLSAGKFGRYSGEDSIYNLDGLHTTLMVGGRFRLNAAMAFKIGVGAVASVQITNQTSLVGYKTEHGTTYEYRGYGNLKLGPSGYLMLDVQGTSMIAFKFGCIFGTYLYGKVCNGVYGQGVSGTVSSADSSNVGWKDWGSYTPCGEYFIWPQASIVLYW